MKNTYLKYQELQGIKDNISNGGFFVLFLFVVFLFVYLLVFCLCSLSAIYSFFFFFDLECHCGHCRKNVKENKRIVGNVLDVRGGSQNEERKSKFKRCMGGK